MSLDKAVALIANRDDFHRIVDELGDNGIAVIITRRTADDGDSQLRLRSYGEGRESDFLGLIGYAQAVLYRDYFQDDDEGEAT